MGSSAKRRTTMAKLNRESRLRERRADKEARKAERRLAAAQDADGVGPDDSGLEEAAAVEPGDDSVDERTE